VAYRFGGVSHVSSPVQMPLAWKRHGEDNPLKDQAYCERLGGPPLNSVECDLTYYVPAWCSTIYCVIT
jgi:hypothetical protein